MNLLNIGCRSIYILVVLNMRLVTYYMLECGIVSYMIKAVEANKEPLKGCFIKV